MKHTGFDYVVKAEVTLTKAEVENIIELGGKHYDFKCMAACKYGGFIYGIKNRLLHFNDGNEEEITVHLMFRELDLMAKILEMGSPTEDEFYLGARISATLKAINAEYKRLTEAA